MASLDVFISYQWDSKLEVLKLKEELEKNKISCWMDENQIFGSVKLNQKIAEGIKNAKVMISCLTNAYTKSDNCYREVAYADQLKKPIIPIRLEQISSSPTGISEILAPLAYINFYGSDRKFEDILRSIKRVVGTESVDGPTERKLLWWIGLGTTIESCRIQGSGKKQLKINELNVNVYQDVCRNLNIPNPGRDYETLAGNLGYNAVEVKQFQLKKNPADVLLSHWGTKFGNTVNKLIKILKDIENNVVAEKLEEALV